MITDEKQFSGPADPLWLRSVLDRLEACVYAKDTEGRYLYVNDEVVTLCGRPREQILGQTDEALHDPQIAEELRDNDRQVLDHGQTLMCEERLVAAGSGQVRCYWTVKQPLMDPHGVVVGLSGISTDIAERKRQEEQATALKNQLAATLQALPDLMFEVDRDGRFFDYHSPQQHLLAVPVAQFLGRTIAEVLPPNVAGVCLQALHEAAEQGHTGGQQYQLDLPDGPHWFELSVSRKEAPVGEPPRFIVLAREITARKQAEQALQAQQSLLRAVVDNTPLEYWARDLDGRCIMENARVVAHWGSLLGTRLEEAQASPEDIALWTRNNQRAYAGEVVDEEVQYVIDGQTRYFQNVIAPIRVEGRIVGIVGFNQDITERKAAAEQIRHLAFYDPLTGLPNRRLMHDRLRQALVGSARRRRQGALMLIDLDHFKVLNDTQGHDAGDQLLVAVAARLSAGIRQGDTAARLGGDEFVVILEDIDGRGEGAVQAEQLALQLQARLREPYDLQLAGRRLSYHCNSSIGIALFDDQEGPAGQGSALSAEELLRRADTAMYQAKAAGRGTLRFFDPRMQAAVAARAGLEADLRRAIEARQFVLHYQPQVGAGGCVTGAEVLVRWLHPERGLVSPAEFIPLAEESGLILPLGDWVLETACQQLVAWARHSATAGLTLAVNVSARQFHQPTLVTQLHALMQRTGVPPSRLKLELTESLLLDHAEEVIARMQALKAMGVGFALDDFGTGYSSLIYLKRLPLDQIKIDQSFVRDVLSDPNDAAIARTILALGNTLGLAVIAEGVETEDQRQFLADNGCHAYQGYLFGRPLPLEGFEAMLAESTVQ